MAVLTNIILTAASALTTLAAFPPYDLYPLAFVSLMPFFYVLCRARDYRQTLLYSLLYGFVFYFFLLIRPAAALGAYLSLFVVLGLGVFLVLFEALFIAAAAVCGRFVQAQLVWGGFGRQLCAALAYAWSWIIFDWLRSLGVSGFTLGGLAYSQYRFVSFIQLARFCGPYGLTFIMVFVNAAGGLFLARVKTANQLERRRWAALAAALSAAVGLYFYLAGVSLRLPELAAAEVKQVTVFQPAIPQTDKLAGDRQALKKLYLENIRAYSQNNKPDLLILPETIVAEFLLNNKEFMFALRDAVDFSLIFGIPRQEEAAAARYYNSVVLLNRYGVLTPLHDKKYLVPFGEYLPLRSLFYGLFAGSGYFDTEYAPGLRKAPVANYATAVCFESTFPYQARAQIGAGGRVLFVLTNDAWFGATPFLDLHLSCAVLRAVENNRYVVQAANTGRSAIIDNRGRILRLSGIGAREWLFAEVRLLTDKTPYTYFGEWPVYLGLVFFLLYFYLLLYAKGRSG